MSDSVFCYCCRIHHAKSAMRRFPTRAGYRWRCVRSIEAARQDAPQRDQFGRQQTAANKQAAARVPEYVRKLRESG